MYCFKIYINIIQNGEGQLSTRQYLQQFLAWRWRMWAWSAKLPWDQDCKMRDFILWLLQVVRLSKLFFTRSLSTNINFKVIYNKWEITDAVIRQVTSQQEDRCISKQSIVNHVALCGWQKPCCGTSSWAGHPKS